MKVPATQELWHFKRSELRRLEDDVVMLDNVNEAQIAHTLRARYECVARGGGME